MAELNRMSRSGTPFSGLTGHGYNTRQAAQHAQTVEILSITAPTLEIVSITASLAQGESVAASSLEAHQTFLEGIGRVTTQVERLEEVLNMENAEMLSCALWHTQIDDQTLTDPYFTKEEWHIVQSRRHELLNDAS